MRLYDTLTRALVELPPPPGPIGMYVCGPTVYQRIHIGNAVPVRRLRVARALARRSADTRYEARPQHHGHQRQDLRRGAGRRARARRRRRRSGTSRTRRRSGSAMPDVAADSPTETMPEISRDDRGAHRARARLRVGRRRLLPRRALRGLRALSRVSGSTRSRSRSRTRAKEDPRDFALWKATKEGEDTLWESPWGVGSPGLAHRVLRDGREAARAGVLDPRRRARSRLPAPRERARAVARASATRSPASGCTTGCCGSRARRWRSRSATSRRSRTCSSEWGRETALVFFLTGHWRKPIDFSDETMTAAARAGGDAPERVCAARRAPPATGTLREQRSTTTSTPRGARSPPRVGADRGPRRAAARGSSVFGLGVAAGDARTRRPRSSSSPTPASPRGRRGTSPRPTGCATRSRHAGWEVRDAGDGFELVPRS